MHFPQLNYCPGEGDNARASQPWMCAPVVGCGCCGGGGGWLASTKRWKAKKMASNRPVPRSTSRTFTALVSFALVSVCAAWVVPGAAMGRLATAMSRVATSTSREEIAVKVYQIHYNLPSQFVRTVQRLQFKVQNSFLPGMYENY